jgi:hypothetical protein
MFPAPVEDKVVVALSLLILVPGSIEGFARARRFICLLRDWNKLNFNWYEWNKKSITTGTKWEAIR